ncbi:DUF2812 domain-containing protein [Slackia heliotrinireducens]|uniref:DUF2812 domain-containing protein n=1 Tax=Slackia heliotrinireducens TaxID=84110 RepID=UPI00331496E2
MRKTWVRFFTIADFEEEEAWLRSQQQNGWKLAKMTPPGIYTFESCAPQDVIYRLDYKNSSQTDEYMQMLKDFGWEYCEQCFGWLYFRKPAASVEAEADGELFSDNASRAEMVGHVVKTRYVPLMIIFLCCVIPNLVLSVIHGGSGAFELVLGIVFGILAVIYVYLIVHCGTKLKAMQERYRLTTH